jgi:hypothetical protein
MMRVDVDFADPLGKQQKTQLLLAVSSLAKTRKVRFIRGDRGVAVLGESISERCIAAALKEFGFNPERVYTSLDPDEDLRADDPPEIMNGPEQVRAIGR